MSDLNKFYSDKLYLSLKKTSNTNIVLKCWESTDELISHIVSNDAHYIRNILDIDKKHIKSILSASKQGDFKDFPKLNEMVEVCSKSCYNGKFFY